MPSVLPTGCRTKGSRPFTTARTTASMPYGSVTSPARKARVVANRLVADKLIDSFYIAPPNEVVFAGSQEPVIKQNRRSCISRSSPTRLQPMSWACRLTSHPQPNRCQAARNKPGERDLGYIAARTAERLWVFRINGAAPRGGRYGLQRFHQGGLQPVRRQHPPHSREQYKPAIRSQKRVAGWRSGLLWRLESSITHVGIYVATVSLYMPPNGEDIKTASVDESNFERRFVGARRYINNSRSRPWQLSDLLGPAASRTPGPRVAALPYDVMMWRRPVRWPTAIAIRFCIFPDRRSTCRLGGSPCRRGTQAGQTEPARLYRA